METGDHSKNRLSLKSQMSRGNFFQSKGVLILVLATLVLSVWGKQVDENTARRVASQTLSRFSATHSVDSTAQLRAQTVQQKTVQLLYKSTGDSHSGSAATAMRAAQANVGETVYFYVFGAENNGGFVIVAGDDRVMPVLGYSYTNSFPADDIPPNLQWWLGEYAKQIAYAIENAIEPTAEVMQQWAQYPGTDNNGKEE